MWISNLFNNIITNLNYSSYLELGVAAGNCWNNVVCESKTGVDSSNNINWHLKDVLSQTTDDFFKSIKNTSNKLILNCKKNAK